MSYIPPNSLGVENLPADPIDGQMAAEEAQDAASFGALFGESMGALGDLPSDIKRDAIAYLRRQQFTSDLGVKSLKHVLGMPRMVQRVDNTGKIVRSTDYPNVGLGVSGSVENTIREAQANIARMEREEQQEAAQIVRRTFIASAQSDAPRGVSEAQLSEQMGQLEKLLDSQPNLQYRQVEAIQLIKRAVADGRDDILHLLFSRRMDMARARWGLDDEVLARALFKARMEKAGNDPNSEVARLTIKYARFLSQQLDPLQHIGGNALRAATQLRTQVKHLKTRAYRR